VVFFHEFGHLVHGLARGNVAWIRLADPERDFMEAPSQLLEEWIFDREVLQRFARHVDTGEPIPAQLVDALRAGRDFGRALYTQWLLFRSMLSLSLHDRNPDDLDPAQLVFDLADRFLPYQIPSDTHFEASFDHLTSYSAGYYTYLWSQVIARDLLNGFTDGLLDPVQARCYRDGVLTAGGTKPAADLVSDFLGRPFAFDAFAAWLSATEPGQS
jgi:Zn-dependent oligopeptidase